MAYKVSATAARTGVAIGAKIGGINFTNIPISVAGNYSDLRYVSFNNQTFNTLSKESNSSLYSMEIFRTASLFQDEKFWISIESNGSVLEDDDLRNTTIGWVLFNADASMKRIYYFEYDESLKNKIQSDCSGGSFTGRFWIDPDVVNAYVDSDAIYIRNSSLNVSFELLSGNSTCVNTTVTNYMNDKVIPNVTYFVNNDVLPGINDTQSGKEDIRESFRDLRSTYNALAIAQWLKGRGLIRDPASMTQEEYDEYVDVIQGNRTYYLHNDVIVPVVGGDYAVPEAISCLRT